MAGKSKSSSETPLMKQYNAIKGKHPDALLLFRVGDFYETFGEDAVKASKILDIVLTKRANGAASHIELAGFPHHALDSYLPKLVRSGLRVAICDQLEDPKSVKGIVKRGVTELVTPGLSLHDQVLDRKYNNYLAALCFSEGVVGFALLDISTGEFLTTEGSEDYISKLVQSFRPSEIIYSKKVRADFNALFREEFNSFSLEDWIFSFDFAYEKLTRHFQTNNLKGFGIEEMSSAIIASGAIMHYLEETEHNELGHISAISRIEEDQFVWLDKFTIRNLELINAQQEGGIPLIHVLDDTVTPMGSRMLKRWLVLPLKDIAQIQNRHKIVESFVKDRDLLDFLRGHLDQIGDLERLVSKVAVGRINPREFISLKNALLHIPPIAEMLSKGANGYLQGVAREIGDCEKLIARIERLIKEEAPILTHQGGYIKDGNDLELDELRKIAFSGKDYLLELQSRESKRTGISSLKIAFNRVFGYYLEVSNTHKDKVPPEWIRKQTLVNAERYITEELKVYEEKILNAEEKIIQIEQKIFEELVLFAKDFVSRVQQNAKIVAMLDCLVSFANIAIKNKYCIPEVNESLTIDIREGRHPVIEKQMPPGESYVPNSVFLDCEDQQIMIVTGPNMAGKSALLRQTALIVLMAQMGSFVPAKSASIGYVDKIFTRVGASDNLSRGESTFMVEMTETASILNNLSDRSLILMDEIGRGTSTYDGVSIAWAIVEYLNQQAQHTPKTLFATHYHELNQLTEDHPSIKNFNVSVKEIGDKVIFLRKLKAGGSEHSFGIHVAQMAGMPNKVVIRASEIMRFLEKDHKKSGRKADLTQLPTNTLQLNLFESDERYKELVSVMDNLDINRISPVEALLKLNELKNMLSSTEFSKKGD